MKTARVIVAESEHDANMLYATGLFVPDPFLYFEIGGRRHVVMSDLEIDRAKREATVDHVHSLTHYQKLLRDRGVAMPRLGEILPFVLKEHGVTAVELPMNFPVGFAQQLKKFRITVKPDPFFEERETKSAAELRKISDALRVTEEAMHTGIEAIRESRIGKDGYLYWRKRKLRSEDLQGLINATIASVGGNASRTIVAGGNQACDPHEIGHGPLRAHQTIILDIFPRNMKTGYWGDMTRTVVRGRASDKVKTIYGLVAEGQQIAFKMLKAGVDGQEVHGRIRALFDSRGFPTGQHKGRMRGFFHGTGHGLGLDIHEAPRVAPVKSILKAGQVVTVEPGLYYPGVGGVRLEDVVVITASSNRLLTNYPKFLEI